MLGEIGLGDSCFFHNLIDGHFFFTEAIEDFLPFWVGQCFTNIRMQLSSEAGGESGILLQGLLPGSGLDDDLAAPGTIQVGSYIYTGLDVNLEAVLAQLSNLGSATAIKLEELLAQVTAAEFFMTPPLEIYIEMEDEEDELEGELEP